MTFVVDREGAGRHGSRGLAVSFCRLLTTCKKKSFTIEDRLSHF
jgi:hypothetical protein